MKGEQSGSSSKNKEAEDIRSSQQGERHTQQKCMRISFGGMKWEEEEERGELSVVFMLAVKGERVLVGVQHNMWPKPLPIFWSAVHQIPEHTPDWLFMITVMKKISRQHL